MNKKNADAQTYAAEIPVKQVHPEVIGWWFDRHDAINERLKKGTVDLLLVGDSIMQGWEGPGKKYWNEYYAPRNAVNMGCGWDCTQHLLWRLDNSDLSHVSPKLAIVLIGTNNWSDPAAEVAAGIIAVCRRLRTALPGMKILLLAIFPRDHEPTELRAKNASASLLASEIADGEMIHSLDISALFLDDSGKLSADIMPDFLHPNETGYKIWAKAVEPVVKNLLGK